MRATWAWVGVWAALAGPGVAPARADDLDAKGAQELLDSVRERLKAREADISAALDLKRFEKETRERLYARRAAAVALIEKDKSRFDEWERTYAAGNVLRAYGDYQAARAKLEQSARKANQPQRRQNAHLDMARLFQLIERPSDSIAELKQAQKGGDVGLLAQAAERVSEIGIKLREFRTQAAARNRAPRDPQAQWGVCTLLSSMRGATGWVGDRYYLALDLLVNLLWMRQQFPEHSIVRTGLVDRRILEVAGQLTDFDEVVLAADRLAADAAKEDYVKGGQLALEVAHILRLGDDTRRTAALRTFRYLEQTWPEHPAVKNGDVAREIGNLTADPGVKKDPPGKKVDAPPWK